MKKNKAPNNSSGTAKLLKVIAKILEKTDSNTLADYLLNNLDINKLRATEIMKSDSQANLNLNSEPQLDLLEIAESLKKLDSRDAGYSFIFNKKLTRVNLEKLGRILGTPILKTDNMERLTAKIIEASIGARLNSDAIRGKSD